MQNSGIFGPTLCGKTTLAKQLVCTFGTKGYSAIILDIFGTNWGNHTAHVFTDETRFWRVTWKSTNCILVVDEASATLRRDKDKTSLFTRARHFGHKLIVIGHSGINLLPEQREQLDWIFLFRQTTKAAELWAETFVDERIYQATNLGEYEFLWARLHPRNVSLHKLTLELNNK